MSLLRKIGFENGFSIDASERLRVGQLNTLIDLKTLVADDSLLLENTGTGTGTFSNNTFNMSVTSGQFYIRRSKRYLHYYSGKSLLAEMTFENFQIEANTTKRVGLFSSNATSPYNSNLDGFFLENDGTTFRIKVYNNGTEKYNVPLSSWNGGTDFSSYDWSKFTVIAFDFVWLGGANLRMFIKTNDGFVLAHTINHSGVGTSTFTQSPNHSVRYEIRSSTGTGSFRYICSQVSAEGSIDDSGKELAVLANTTALSLTTVGTNYLLRGLRKQISPTNYRNKAIELIDFNAFINSADQLRISLHLNPTLSATPTWNNIANSGAQECTGNGTITLTAPGTVIYSQVLTQNSIMPYNFLEKNFLSELGVSIADISDELIIGATPLSATVAVFGSFRYREY